MGDPKEGSLAERVGRRVERDQWRPGGVGETWQDWEGRGEWGTLLQTGRGWGEPGRQVSGGAGDTWENFRHCGVGTEGLCEQETNREQRQVPELRGQGLGGYSCGRGHSPMGCAGGWTGRAGWAGVPRESEAPRSGLCSRSRPEPSEPGGAWSGEEGREGRGGGTRRPPSTGHPASGAPWWGVEGRLREVDEEGLSIPGFKFYLHLRHWATPSSRFPFLTRE